MIYAILVPPLYLLTARLTYGLMIALDWMVEYKCAHGVHKWHEHANCDALVRSGRGTKGWRFGWALAWPLMAAIGIIELAGRGVWLAVTRGWGD